MKNKNHLNELSHLLPSIQLLLALVALLSVVGFTSQKGMAASCTIDSKLVNSCRPWIGAATGGYTMAPSGSAPDSQFSFFEKRMNNPGVLSNPNASTNMNYYLDFVHAYHTPTQTSLKAPEIIFGARASTYLLMNWKPAYAWADAGGGDATTNSRIDAMANTIKALAPTKVLLTVFHEPENDVTTGSAGGCSTKAGASTGTPTEYVNMWHNVRARFDAKGVNNVVWAMNYMGFSNWNCLVPLLWPGNSYVDWVLWDPYSGGNETFAQKVQIFYDFLTNNSDSTHNYLSKNWGLGEFGYWNSGGDSTEAGAVAYWNGAKAAIQNNTFPKLKLLATFDTNADAGGNYNGPSMIGYNNDGSISISEQTAFNSFAASILDLESSGGGGEDTPVADTTKPTVSFSSPANGSTVSKVITINVNASDDVGVTGVDIYYDDVNVIKKDKDGSDGWSSQWNTWNVSNGNHSLKATAKDAAGNTATATINITVSNSVAAPIINSFSSSPSTVTAGSKTTLNWSSGNAASCSVSPGGPTDTTATSWTTLALTEIGTKTYTLTCKNSTGTTVTETTSVSIKPSVSPPKDVVLSASSTSVKSGSLVTLSWISSGSTGCTLNPGNITSSGASGSATVTAKSTTTYKVTCINSAGNTDSQGVTVTVSSTAPLEPAKPVINSFTASDKDISYGSSVTLTWQASNVAEGGCLLDPSPLLSANPSGSWTSQSLKKSVSYTLTCKNGADEIASKSLSIIVDNQPAPKAPKAANADQIKVPDQITNGETTTVESTTGEDIVYAQFSKEVTKGQLLVLDSGTVTDPDKIKLITKVEYYSSDTLVQTITEKPFALNTGKLPTGSQTITQRTYYKDGSMSELTQVILVKSQKSDNMADSRKGTGTAELWATGTATAIIGGSILLFVGRMIIFRMRGYGLVASLSLVAKDISSLYRKSKGFLFRHDRGASTGDGFTNIIRPGS